MNFKITFDETEIKKAKLYMDKFASITIGDKMKDKKARQEVLEAVKDKVLEQDEEENTSLD